MAVMPSAVAAGKIDGALFSAFMYISTSALDMRNRKTPGIMDTTDAKAKAAKGIFSLCAKGVATNPAKKQATATPIGAL
ncbi:hypothetical protein ICHIJ1_04990 [Fluviibacter phosphoraccumulans]|uniref:Uncharacterized protein n=1 Tax=Fluviibacter phosphoraccumulans TaxID=1751046 RepID=A0A679IAZ7_9RHOO|nr:hypothetical protein ICHIAU1_01640 [Fluviibacter phosphoraccumulans]BBU70580.1 hypothetical protein ICHIJ1_04990 [Fluviibacter phosphoraccumulans]BCA66069.1 hypothetical protein SHINM1_016710 [Fluviibacter phosphoraccumulans]